MTVLVGLPSKGSDIPREAPEFKAIRAFVGSPFAAVHSGSVTHGGPEQWSPAIRTLEGVMRIDSGDWVIRGVKGEFYPCKPDIFEATYERAEDAAAKDPWLVPPELRPTCPLNGEPCTSWTCLVDVCVAPEEAGAGYDGS